VLVQRGSAGHRRGALFQGSRRRLISAR